jgi:hypothetical protein
MTNRPPVDVRIALGLTRNPKTDTDHAVRETTNARKRDAYDIVNIEDDGRTMSVLVPVLKETQR